VTGISKAITAAGQWEIAALIAAASLELFLGRKRAESAKKRIPSLGRTGV